MQIAIHNSAMEIVDYLNNDIPEALHYRDDLLELRLPEASALFTFTVSKWYNGRLNKRIAAIDDQSYFSLRYKGRDYLFMVSQLEETDWEITVTCETLNLELLNENRREYKSSGPLGIVDHLNAMQILEYSNLEIGINQVADRTLSVEFDSDETNLKRILGLMVKFDAEPEFEYKLNRDGSLDKLILNIYASRTDDKPYNGVGVDRTDVRLYFGRDVSGITRTIDKTNLYNAVRVVNSEGEQFTFQKEHTVKNEEGLNDIIVRRRSSTAYAPNSMRMFPSVLNKNACDLWTVRTLQADYEDEDLMWAYVVKELKKHMYPIVTYDIDLSDHSVLSNYDLDVGDTIYIHDENFIGGLLLKARVQKIDISFSDHSRSKITLSNVVTIANAISTGLQAQMEAMVLAALPYTLRLKTNNGTHFKDFQGSTTITPQLIQNNDIVSADDYVWFMDGTYAYTGKEFTVTPELMPDGRLVVACEAMLMGNMVAREELTFTDVHDGVSPILMHIDSTQGNVFRNNNISTTLSARLFQGEREIDVGGDMFAYIWTKVDEFGQVDEEWNNKHKVSSKELIITDDDVYRKSVFTCEATPIYFGGR